MQAVRAWAPMHLDRLAAIHAADLGGTVEDWQAFPATVPWSFSPVGGPFLVGQQQVADTLHRSGSLPEPMIVVVEAHEPAPAEAVRAALTAAGGQPAVRLRAARG
ncbi:hypothetical protein [Patulibacter defluvii]|uniref:hypothetical protein n=1 Tax=Patulibacter defluvii TaxID=3095358 RepID=UPI002A74DCC5|nr:hypothetical protein [Patulibacter sp. DM4]